MHVILAFSYLAGLAYSTNLSGDCFGFSTYTVLSSLNKNSFTSSSLVLIPLIYVSDSLVLPSNGASGVGLELRDWI